jgi:hypothetical protein
MFLVTFFWMNLCLNTFEICRNWKQTRKLWRISRMICLPI